MNQETEEAFETYINGNIKDARKYFKANQEEISEVVDQLIQNEQQNEARTFLRLMLGGQ